MPQGRLSVALKMMASGLRWCRAPHPPLTRGCFGGIIVGPRFTKTVQALPSIVPFVAPEEMERVRGRPFEVRLGANELTFGPSPKAVAAMQAAAGDVWKYGDPKSFELRTALADRLGITPGHLVVGEGVDGLLSYTAQLLINEGDAVVTSRGTYPTLNYFVAGRGGVLHTVPYRSDRRQDLDGLLARAHEVKDATDAAVPSPPPPRRRRRRRVVVLVVVLVLVLVVVVVRHVSHVAGGRQAALPLQPGQP